MEGVTGENTAAALPATSPVTITDPANSNENASTSEVDDKAVLETAESIVCDVPVADNETCDTTTATEIEEFEDAISVSVEDELSAAMASTKISSMVTTVTTANTADVKQNDVKVGLVEMPKETATSDREEGEISVVDDDIGSDHDVSVKTALEHDNQMNSTMDSMYEDTHEYTFEVVNGVEKEPYSDEKSQECVPDVENELLEGEKIVEPEGGEETEVAEPVVPVPVDNDTNDPQYIPRRGRFYEHDDRMAYSTTSSEGSSESSDGYEEDSGDDNDKHFERHRNVIRHTGIKKRKPVAVEDSTENATTDTDSFPSKKVLNISKAAAITKDSPETPITSASGSSKKPGAGFKKSRDIDSLPKWTHDMYNEDEQTRKSRDELLASYGYDIREESEAPRARRHHKYGRTATAKYTRNWQDTKAYIGGNGRTQSPKVKRGVMGRRSLSNSNKNQNKSTTSDEYSSEFPSLSDPKPSTSTTVIESPAVTAASPEKNQPSKSLPVHNEEKMTAETPSTCQPSWHHVPSPEASFKHETSSPNQNSYQDQQNGRTLSHNRNHLKKNTDSYIERRDSPSNQNLFKRKPQPFSGGHQKHQNYKQQHYNNSPGHNQQSPHSFSPRGRNLNLQHNNQQFNRDRYFSKGVLPSNNTSLQHHNSFAPVIAGTGRTQHTSGNYHHYNNRQYENENHQTEQPVAPPPPVVRSSKRYSVQSRRELPDPVLNFGSMGKTSQLQHQPSVPQHQHQSPVQQHQHQPSIPHQHQPSISQHQHQLQPSVQQHQHQPSVQQHQHQPSVQQHQQQNGLVIQEQQQPTMQQMQPPPQQLQQQQPLQIHQQQPPMQIQQYHQSLQQMHPHHGMVLDHNTGMMVMAAPDPTMYHHQLYAAPQYATAVTPGSAANNTDDQNAAVAAAAALQMLAQAAVYQPVPTGATVVTPPPPNTQSMQQQQPETFMTTYYQPQQQPQQQPPPRRINLAIPIVAPPPEPNMQPSVPKTNLSQTPPPTAMPTN